MLLRAAFVAYCSILLAGCAHNRAATFRFVDAQTGLPAPNVEVAPLYAMSQPQIPLAFPVKVWFPITDGEVYSDSQGEVSFDSVSDKAKFRINKDGYREILVESAGSSIKMKYLPDEKSVARRYDNGIVTIPLKRR